MFWVLDRVQQGFKVPLIIHFKTMKMHVITKSLLVLMTYTCYTLSQKGLIFLGPSGRSNKGSNILYFISSIESFSKVMTIDSIFLNAHQSCGFGVRTLSASGCHFKL